MNTIFRIFYSVVIVNFVPKVQTVVKVETIPALTYLHQLYFKRKLMVARWAIVYSHILFFCV